MTYSEFLLSEDFNLKNVIYRFKNKKNGKVYIGQTSALLRTRVILHMTAARPHTKAHKSYFGKALNKYGFEAFEISVIEICRDKTEYYVKQ